MVLVPGPWRQQRAELLAFGLGYVGPLGNGGLEWILRGDHGEAVPGGTASRAADLRITSTNLSFGMRQTAATGRRYDPSCNAGLQDPQHHGHHPFGPRAGRASQGDPGQLPARNRCALWLSHAAGGSVWRMVWMLWGPVSRPTPWPRFPAHHHGSCGFRRQPDVTSCAPVWVINAGIAAQWADASLPLSERCGYATNAFSRGFDQTVANGDRCIAGRLEAARYLVLPPADRPDRALVQGFAGLDGGSSTTWPIRSCRPPRDWSSLSLGVRFLRGAMVGEVAASRVLDDFAGQDPAASGSGCAWAWRM